MTTNLPTKDQFLATGFTVLTPSAVPPDDRKCSICLNVYGSGGSSEPPIQLQVCNHIFGRECIEGWASEGGNSCPICRAVLFEAEEVPDDEELAYHLFSHPPRIDAVNSAQRVAGQRDERFYAVNDAGETLSSAHAFYMWTLGLIARVRHEAEDRAMRELEAEFATATRGLTGARSAMVDLAGFLQNLDTADADAEGSLRTVATAVSGFCRLLLAVFPHQGLDSVPLMPPEFYRELEAMRLDTVQRRDNLPRDLPGTREQFLTAVRELEHAIMHHPRGLLQRQQDLERARRELPQRANPWLTVRVLPTAINLQSMREWFVNDHADAWNHADDDARDLGTAFGNIAAWVLEHDDELPTKDEFLASGFDSLTVDEVPEEDRKCSICLNEYDGHGDDNGETPVRLNACGHIFGLECITLWANEDIATGNKCPTCRSVLFEGDEEEEWAEEGADDGEPEEVRLNRVSYDAYANPARLHNNNPRPVVGQRDDRAYDLGPRAEELSRDEMSDLWLVVQDARARLEGQERNMRRDMRRWQVQEIRLVRIIPQLMEQRAQLQGPLTTTLRELDASVEGDDTVKTLEAVSVAVEGICEWFDDDARLDEYSQLVDIDFRGSMQEMRLGLVQRRQSLP
ncbi:uncharacterized protein K452DRAFT_316025 [Aplosporella prunicola CBS 121167]|uniref:RING-type domain-containing protein n=1 Tax=Aplosporella prunicola CBS 121167 TaxID=1176127 RepID=A0A6A6BLE3_9PEZI|nr:uncharacterized protein K452DRAFT_316025 [Aplosporella prunicola CBS 121167]KAF2144866.1 hypothetical protein K452DRAFT_316025 [Aplosporella prunicola CBS 121167]